MGTFAEQIDTLLKPKPASRARTLLVEPSDGFNGPVLYRETPADVEDRMWADAALNWLQKIEGCANGAVSLCLQSLEEFDRDADWPTAAGALAGLLEARAQLVLALSQAGAYARRAGQFVGATRESIQLGNCTRNNAHVTLPAFRWNVND